MNLILTSDFPATPSAAIVRAINAAAAHPRIAWIPAATDSTGASLTTVREQFAAVGLDRIESLDIDEERDEVQLAYLHEFDVIVLSDGDPLQFRYNAIRSGLSGRLRQCASAGSLIVGTGGGALLLTPNVSLLRLQQETVDQVLATRGRFDALAAVDYEVLPHRDRWPQDMLERVREYSTRIEHDIVALSDGAAVFPTTSAAFTSDGAITRYRKGTIIEA